MAPSRPTIHLLPGRSGRQGPPSGRVRLRAAVFVLLALLALAVVVIAILTAVGAFTPSTAAPHAHGTALSPIATLR